MSQEDHTFTDDQEDVNILDYFLKYLRYWHLILLSLAISLTFTFFYLTYYTPVYQVNATLLIKDAKKVNDEVLEKLDMENSGKLVENEIEKLKSRALIGKVVDKINLTVSFWLDENIRDTELFNESPIRLAVTEITDFAHRNSLYVGIESGNTYQLFDNEQTSLGHFDYNQLVTTKYGKFRILNHDSLNKDRIGRVKVVFQNRDALINTLTNQLQIALLNYESNLISLSLETTLPDKGKEILTNLLDEYTFTTLEGKNREAANTLNFIEERLKLVTSELGNVEQNIEQYRRAKGISDLASEANVLLGKITENDTRLSEIDTQIKVLIGVEQYLNSTQVGIVAPATMMGVSDPVLKSYIDQLSQLEIERSKLAQTVQPGNLYLETINNRMRNVKQAILENLTIRKRSLYIARRNLDNLNNQLKKSIATIPHKEREFVSIKRQANIKEELYLLLLRTREQTAIYYASAVTDSRIVDVPYSTGEVIKPNKKTIYLWSILLGLAVPIAFITLKDLLTSTVQSKQEIERKTGLPVLAEIITKSKNKEGFTIGAQDRSLMGEQVRLLRSKLQHLLSNAADGPGKTVLITSSTCGEGKSFIALNLATSLAMLDKKVIILGLDLRKPKKEDYPGINNTVGISSYLTGELDIEDIILDTSLPNLYIIPSGHTPTNPSEMIENGRVKKLINSLKGSFDYIVIDTAPVGLVTDATLLAPFADVCFYIVRHNVTPKFYLKTINDFLRQGIFNSLTIVFNAVNYKYSSDHRYGYGYGNTDYYDKSSSKKGRLSRLSVRP